MPISDKKFTYRVGFKPPYSHLAYDGEDFYLLPRQVGKKFMGLKKASVTNKNGIRKVLYNGVRVSIAKLVTEYKVEHKNEKEVLL
jgi:hypothetical protein